MSAPKDQSEVQGQVSLSVAISTPSLLTHDTLTVRSDGAPDPYSESVDHAWSPADKQQADAIDAVWDTQRLQSQQGPLPNGVYEVIVTATVTGSPTPAQAVISGLRLNNPPATPLAPVATLQSGHPVVELGACQILPFPGAPDLLPPVFQRSVAGGAFSDVGAPVVETGSPPVYRLDDLAAPHGTELRYRTVAVRKSPVTPDGIRSAPSSPSPALVWPSVVTTPLPTPSPERWGCSVGTGLAEPSIREITVVRPSPSASTPGTVASPTPSRSASPPLRSSPAPTASPGAASGGTSPSVLGVRYEKKSSSRGGILGVALAGTLVVLCSLGFVLFRRFRKLP